MIFMNLKIGIEIYYKEKKSHLIFALEYPSSRYEKVWSPIIENLASLSMFGCRENDGKWKKIRFIEKWI